MTYTAPITETPCPGNGVNSNLVAQNAPSVPVTGYGSDMRVDLPTSTGTGGAISYSAFPPGLPAGSYLVVFLWQGDAWENTPQGETNWHTRVRSEGLNCANVAAGSLYSFDQRDMAGQQIHAPGAGLGSNLLLDAPVPHSISVGAVVAGAVGGVGGAELTLSDAKHSRTVRDLLRPWVSTAQVVRHQAQYQGVQPLLLHAGVSFDLI